IRDKGINCPLNCVVCNGNFEDSTRVLFLCPFAASIWRDSGVWNYVEAAVNSSNTVAETIFLLLQNLEEQKSARLAVIMWSIWKHCDIKLWNNVTETREQILNRVDHLLEDWRAAKNTKKTNNAAEAEMAVVMPLSWVQLHRQEQAAMCWQKPETSRIHWVVGITTNDE
ncbi:cytochrome p450, partial [Trifolium pratense]